MPTTSTERIFPAKAPRFSGRRRRVPRYRNLGTDGPRASSGQRPCGRPSLLWRFRRWVGNDRRLALAGILLLSPLCIEAIVGGFEFFV